MISKKPPLKPEQQQLFFFWLGYRLFASTLRGRMLGHKRPLSTIRDYLDPRGLEGADAEAAEFLIDLSRLGRVPDRSIHPLIEQLLE